MSITAYTTLVSQVVQFLPGALVSVLDAWSHRVAQRRARARQQRWLQRQAAPAADPAVKYQLKPWRD
jgi:hypothetical protein